MHSYWMAVGSLQDEAVAFYLTGTQTHTCVFERACVRALRFEVNAQTCMPKRYNKNKAYCQPKSATARPNSGVTPKFSCSNAVAMVNFA